MKHIVFLLSSLLMSLVMMAQTESIPLFPDGVPGLKPNSGVEEELIDKGDGFSRYGNVTTPEIFPFIPKNADGKTPAVIICPGGGYSYVCVGHEGFAEAKWLNEKGIAAFVVKYRLPEEKAFDNKSMVPLQDVQQAFKYVHDNAKKYNIDKKKIGVMGFSAGGHLAASASVHYDDPQVDAKPKVLRPAFSILVYPVISFTDTLTHKGSRNRLIGPEWTKEQVDYFSNEKQVTKQTPPAILIHAKDDGAVPPQNSVVYKEALEKNGVDVKLVMLDKGGHGFGIKPNSPTNVWLDDLEAWLKDQDLLK